MSRTATTIEQGKKLLELGLDPKTADCNWNTTFGEWCQCIGKNSFAVESGLAVPAWSLSAMWEVMPSEIRFNGDDYSLQMHKWYDPEIEMTKYEIGYYDRSMYSPKGGFADSTDPTDLAFELMVWLLENNLIKR